MTQISSVGFSGVTLKRSGRSTARTLARSLPSPMGRSETDRLQRRPCN